MITFNDLSFNGQYLSALEIATRSPHVAPSRLGDMVNLGQAFFEIKPNDPRLVFLSGRKLNAVFAIVEACWVLRGSNELAPLAREIATYGDFSDDGVTLNGAYGYRLRSYFDFDQIEQGLEILKLDPSSRRVVLSLYDTDDLGKRSKDIPCNTSVFLKIIDRKLDLTVINRSNDLFLGVPYNIFTFGILQAYLAKRLGMDIGNQRHFTDCLHAYTENLLKIEAIVRANKLSEVEERSAAFNWEYSAAILENANAIVDDDFRSITSDGLRAFLLSLTKDDCDRTTHSDSDTHHTTFYTFLADRVIGRRSAR
ncbi:thymidylate synthase [Paraburkholderia sabiae]|uniref:thymidylate synthase n=1 Tax=Paraburkholderia sabiae TaxID=273251 RepID=A0ABU9QQE6_9BURK|nr:thymidylate synthase [Paraburkholderia sabiae]WJZ74389.1 thymidylate synthase [Paraburkholderia sabiae]CAD6562649.1 Thymidylate synthase [Paraburkholderia sabiae]